MSKELKELKAKINIAIIQLENELSTWVNCSSNISDEFREIIKNDYKRRLTALSDAINELGKKEFKALEIIKECLIAKDNGDSIEIACEFSIPKKIKRKYNLLKEVLDL